MKNTVSTTVVGRWTARDAHLRDHLKKVWVISKEFDSLFMEFIPKEHNFHADRIANAAIDKELQIQEVVSNYFDQSNGAWQGSYAQSKDPALGLLSPPARILTTGFSNLKLRPVSPIREAHSTITGSSKPLASALKSAVRVISQPRILPVDDVQTSDSDLTRTIQSFTSTKAADKFWADRLSISDEATTCSTASDEGDAEPGYFKASSLKTGLENRHANPARGSGDDDSAEELPEFCKTHLDVNNVEHPAQLGESHSTLQLSEADCDRLVEAVIERLKKTRVGNPNDTTSCLQHHLQ